MVACLGKDIVELSIFCYFLNVVLNKMCNFRQHCIFQCYFPDISDTVPSTDKDPSLSSSVKCPRSQIVFFVLAFFNHCFYSPREEIEPVQVLVKPFYQTFLFGWYGFLYNTFKSVKSNNIRRKSEKILV